MHSTVEEAKAEFLRSKDRLVKNLATTPDDKLNWSPSPSSRTPIQQVAHAATSISMMQKAMSGGGMPEMSIHDMDAQFRESEKQFTTREAVLAHLDAASNGYVAFLDSLTPEQIASNWETPFGSFPMASAITFPADHNRCHAGQMEYIQTIYGDLDWHMG